MSWQVSRWARDQRAGSAVAKAVLMILAEHVVDDDATCFLGVTAISERAESKRTATLGALDMLEDRGLIARTRRNDPFGHRTSDTIRLLMVETQGSECGPRAVAKVCEADVGGEPRSVKRDAKVRETTSLGPPDGPYKVSDKVSVREKAASPRAKPLTSIAEGFPDRGLIERERTYLQKKGWNIDPSLEAEKFRSYVLNKDRRNRDWPAAFRSWIVKAIEYAPPSARIAPIPSAITTPAATPWRQRVKAFADPANRYWNATDWGPAPGRNGCKAPVEIVAELIGDPTGKVVPIGRAAVA